LNPRAVMVRMPAFGLDGPWRDRPGFATTMEQLSGMCWTTGFPEGPPVNPAGVGDPIAGTHAVLATLVALEQRDRTGEGLLAEVPLIEPALNVSAEAVLEAQAYGVVLDRIGNRSRSAAPQNAYPARGDDQWLAISVESDEQWRALVHVLGDPEWARDERFDTVDGRRATHDELDERLATWTRAHDAPDAAEDLVAVGVPAAPVIHPRDLVSNPQVHARGLYRRVTHAEAGEMWLPTAAIRFASQPYPWPLSPAPSLAEHTDAILAEAGYSADEVAAFWDAGVVSNRLAS
jgi:crotonobetainyl-CoA:carnitine CoA-transferase CaiB-like acyl-CoA transferase